MPSCAVCGTSVRDAATHCTTCGTPTGFAPPPPPPPAPVPVVSPPSPFESEESWRDPMPPIAPEAARNGGLPASATGPRATAPSRSRRSTLLAGVALVIVVAAVLAVVALPRLLGGVDPQKYVGTWAYTAATPSSVIVTRHDTRFTITFVDENGSRQALPGKISDGKLVIDYDALGPQGAVVKNLAERIGAKLSFAYRASDDHLVLNGSNPQGSFSLILHRSVPG